MPLRSPGSSENGSRGQRRRVDRSIGVAGARVPVSVGIPAWSRTPTPV